MPPHPTNSLLRLLSHPNIKLTNQEKNYLSLSFTLTSTDAMPETFAISAN